MSDLPRNDAAMLRYWFSERTLWLADVFGEPEPLGAADIPVQAIDSTTQPGALDLRDDTAVCDRERVRLARLLGR